MNQSEIFENTTRFRQYVIDKLTIIENLNIKQNGTIKENIKKINNLKAWKNKVVGALIITDIILIPIVITLLAKIL